MLSMQSCEDSIPLPDKEVDAKLVFESEINPATGFRAKISTSTGLTNVTSSSIPTDLDVVINTIDEVVFKMLYEEDCFCYKYEGISPKQGVRYQLKASAPDSDIYEDITSSMVFPRAIKPLEISAVRNIELDGSTTVNTSITLEINSTSSEYYHILPYRKETRIVLNNDGEEEEMYTGKIFHLDFVDFDNDNLYIENLYNQPGFLVDYNSEDISSTPLNLLLHIPEVINYEGDEEFTKVFYEIRTLTESHYDNVRYLSRKLDVEENGGVVNQPISPKGNIINGLGYFGGYSSVEDSISVQ